MAEPEVSQCAGAREGRSNVELQSSIRYSTAVSMRRSAGGSFEHFIASLPERIWCCLNAPERGRVVRT